MKILTVGMSPYTLTSRGKLHSWVIKYLYLNGMQITSVVWGHDTSYFIPEEVDGKERYFYNFDFNELSHKVPIRPFSGKQDHSVEIYELLNALEPDVVVTIGDITDFLFMRAVKMFYTNDLSWVSVMMNYGQPVNEDHREIFQDMDGILCTSKICREGIEDLFQKDHLEDCIPGCNTSIYRLKDQEELRRERGCEHKFRIMASGKVTQVDNLPMVMQAVSELRDEIPNVELYIHANVYDNGEYDLETVRNRFDPNHEFIKFPEKYVSISDGPPEEELADELNASDLFISAPLASATSLSVIEALGCGCMPIMSDCGSNRNIAELLEEELSGKLTKNDFLVECIELMTVGEVYLSVCNKDRLKEKIAWAYKNKEKIAGYKKDLSQFTRKYKQKEFMSRLSNMITAVKGSNKIICLETQ